MIFLKVTEQHGAVENQGVHIGICPTVASNHHHGVNGDRDRNDLNGIGNRTWAIQH